MAQSMATAATAAACATPAGGGRRHRSGCTPRLPAAALPFSRSSSSLCQGGRRCSSATAASAQAGFHQAQLVATERTGEALPPLPSLDVRHAEADEELEAAAWLRALSFYRYPPERKFAGELHQLMMAEEEYKLLRVARMQRRLERSPAPAERSACLVALAPAEALPAADARLAVGGGLELVGTLDLHAVRALEGEILIGNSRNAAYLANVCTSTAARRRGVGQALLHAARQLAREWGVDAIYVHTMAVNEAALRFYEQSGFVVEKEETSNQAHYRGRCLDGIEGRARSVLLRDTQLD